jgi:pimeloyl-ACP methyl ester carboxylesterase
MLDILISTSRKTFPEIPVFIYGHSLGGGIVLDYLLRSGQEIKGAIVTSPWLLLSFKPDRIRIILARIMKGLIPGLIQPSGLVVSHISHDQVVVEKYLADPLVHNKISVSMVYEANLKSPYLLCMDLTIRSPHLKGVVSFQQELIRLNLKSGMADIMNFIMNCLKMKFLLIL